MGAESSTLYASEALGTCLDRIERRINALEGVSMQSSLPLPRGDCLAVPGIDLSQTTDPEDRVEFTYLKARHNVNIVLGPLIGLLKSDSVRILIEIDTDAEIELVLFKQESFPLPTASANPINMGSSSSSSAPSASSADSHHHLLPRVVQRQKVIFESYRPLAVTLSNLESNTSYVLYVTNINSEQILPSACTFRTPGNLKDFSSTQFFFVKGELENNFSNSTSTSASGINTSQIFTPYSLWQELIDRGTSSYLYKKYESNLVQNNREHSPSSSSSISSSTSNGGNRLESSCCFHLGDLINASSRLASLCVSVCDSICSLPYNPLDLEEKFNEKITDKNQINHLFSSIYSNFNDCLSEINQLEDEIHLLYRRTLSDIKISSLAQQFSILFLRSESESARQLCEALLKTPSSLALSLIQNNEITDDQNGTSASPSSSISAPSRMISQGWAQGNAPYGKSSLKTRETLSSNVLDAQLKQLELRKLAVSLIARIFQRISDLYLRQLWDENYTTAVITSTFSSPSTNPNLTRYEKYGGSKESLYRELIRLKKCLFEKQDIFNSLSSFISSYKSQESIEKAGENINEKVYNEVYNEFNKTKEEIFSIGKNLQELSVSLNNLNIKNSNENFSRVSSLFITNNRKDYLIDSTSSSDDIINPSTFYSSNSGLITLLSDQNLLIMLDPTFTWIQSDGLIKNYPPNSTSIPSEVSIDPEFIIVLNKIFNESQTYITQNIRAVVFICGNSLVSSASNAKHVDRDDESTNNYYSSIDAKKILTILAEWKQNAINRSVLIAQGGKRAYACEGIINPIINNNSNDKDTIWRSNLSSLQFINCSSILSSYSQSFSEKIQSQESIRSYYLKMNNKKKQKKLKKKQKDLKENSENKDEDEDDDNDDFDTYPYHDVGFKVKTITRSKTYQRNFWVVKFMPEIIGRVIENKDENNNNNNQSPKNKIIQGTSAYFVTECITDPPLNSPLSTIPLIIGRTTATSVNILIDISTALGNSNGLIEVVCCDNLTGMEFKMSKWVQNSELIGSTPLHFYFEGLSPSRSYDIYQNYTVEISLNNDDSSYAASLNEKENTLLASLHSKYSTISTQKRQFLGTFTTQSSRLLERMQLSFTEQSYQLMTQVTSQPSKIQNVGGNIFKNDKSLRFLFIGSLFPTLNSNLFNNAQFDSNSSLEFLYNDPHVYGLKFLKYLTNFLTENPVSSFSSSSNFSLIFHGLHFCDWGITMDKVLFHLNQAEIYFTTHYSSLSSTTSSSSSPSTSLALIHDSYYQQYSYSLNQAEYYLIQALHFNFGSNSSIKKSLNYNSHYFLTSLLYELLYTFQVYSLKSLEKDLSSFMINNLITFYQKIIKNYFTSINYSDKLLFNITKSDEINNDTINYFTLNDGKTVVIDLQPDIISHQSVSLSLENNLLSPKKISKLKQILDSFNLPLQSTQKDENQAQFPQKEDSSSQDQFSQVLIILTPFPLVTSDIMSLNYSNVSSDMTFTRFTSSDTLQVLSLCSSWALTYAPSINRQVIFLSSTLTLSFTTTIELQVDNLPSQDPGQSQVNNSRVDENDGVSIDENLYGVGEDGLSQAPHPQGNIPHSSASYPFILNNMNSIKKVKFFQLAIGPIIGPYQPISFASTGQLSSPASNYLLPFKYSFQHNFAPNNNKSTVGIVEIPLDLTNYNNCNLEFLNMEDFSLKFNNTNDISSFAPKSDNNKVNFYSKNPNYFLSYIENCLELYGISLFNDEYESELKKYFHNNDLNIIKEIKDSINVLIKKEKQSVAFIYFLLGSKSADINEKNRLEIEKNKLNIEGQNQDDTDIIYPYLNIFEINSNNNIILNFHSLFSLFHQHLSLLSQQILKLPSSLILSLSWKIFVSNFCINKTEFPIHFSTKADFIKAEQIALNSLKTNEEYFIQFLLLTFSLQLLSEYLTQTFGVV